nr:hypothetical protein [Agrobacterium sp. T29]
MQKARCTSGMLLRILCAIAFVCIGFAHKPPQVKAQTFTPAELALYTLPDGTLPVLCLPTDDGHGGHGDGDHGLGTGCEACRLTATAILPTPADMCGSPILHEITFNLLVPSEATYRQLFPPNSSPRAPPFTV